MDLTVNLAERHGEDGSPHGIDGVITYRTDLFEQDTATALGERLLQVLRAVTDTPGRRIASVDVLSEDERHLLLEEWNDTATPVPSATVPELFQRQVRETPDATALVADGVHITYEDLNSRAN
uniref:hypothetical protein n=1 Tax=Streptomyces sp. ms184 TaxID=1827974 RepID=UPI00117E6DB4